MQINKFISYSLCYKSGGNEYTDMVKQGICRKGNIQKPKLVYSATCL